MPSTISTPKRPATLLSAHAATPQAQRIREAVLSAAKRRDRYADVHVADLTAALKKSSDAVAEQVREFEDLAASRKPWQTMRLDVLKNMGSQIDKIAAELLATWKVGLHANVDGALKLGLGDVVGQLQALRMPDFKSLSGGERDALVTRTFSTIDRSAVDFLANYEVTLLGDVSAELAGGIKRTITRGVLEGRSIPDVARDIGKAVVDPEGFKTAGKTVFKTAQQRATLIARTETLRAHNEGRKVFYHEAGVAKVKWLTAHDERLCPECAPLDGRVYQVDEAPGPPKHPGCRCTVYAVVVGYNDSE